MAKLMRFSPARNESEDWAGKFLKKNLPDPYIVYAGLFVSHSQQVYEVDFLVVAEYALHFIDAKGYTGIVEPGQGAWSVGGAFVNDDPLDKVVMHAKRFAGVWRSTYLNQWTPWFEGCIFVTGERGENVQVHKDSDIFKVFAPKEICDHLQQATHRDERNRVTPEIRKNLEKLLGLTIRLRGGEQHLNDFRLVGARQKVSQGHYRQEAEYQLASLLQRYTLDIVDLNDLPPAITRAAAQHELHAKFKLHECLQGILGIPRCLPLVMDQAQALCALPVQKNEGMVLQQWIKENNPDFALRLKIFDHLVRILADAHARGVCHGGLEPDKIRIADDFVYVSGFGDVAGAGTMADAISLIQAVMLLFSADAVPLGSLTVKDITNRRWMSEFKEKRTQAILWCEKCLGGDQDCLISQLSPVAAVQPEDIPEPVAGSVVNGHYKLLSVLGEGATARVWEAEHTLSGMPCTVKIMSFTEYGLQIARDEFRILSSLLHPNVIRTFSFEQIRGTDLYCLVNEVGAKMLSDCFGEERPSSAAQSLRWFEGCLSALECLRKCGVIHKDIKPANITISGDIAKLIDFNVSAQIDTSNGTPSYKSPSVEQGGWSFDADLYSLCLSFYEYWSGRRAFEGRPAEFFTPEPFALPGLSAATVRAITEVLQGHFTQASVKLADFFGLIGFAFSLDNRLPADLVRAWKLTHVDQECLLSMLVQRGGRCTKQQLINATLTWRGQSCSERNIAGQSARLNPLRDMDLLQYPPGRQKKGAHIYVQLTKRALGDCRAHGVMP